MHFIVNPTTRTFPPFSLSVSGDFLPEVRGCLRFPTIIRACSKNRVKVRKRSDGALVRISSPTFNTEAAVKEHSEFIQAVFPYLTEFLPD
jgi:hypothetical protein